MKMILPTSPREFIQFMETIWEIKSEPAPSGLVLFAHPLYDNYADARRVARLAGMHRTGGTLLDGEHADVWRFHDNGQGVVILHGGSACALGRNAFGPRRAT